MAELITRWTREDLNKKIAKISQIQLQHTARVTYPRNEET